MAIPEAKGHPACGGMHQESFGQLHDLDYLYNITPDRFWSTLFSFEIALNIPCTKTKWA